MTLSILIVNWNTKELVLRCIDSVLRGVTDLDFEVIVVDNASSDDSLEALQAGFGSEPRVKIVKSETNLGFANANNLAFKKSSGEYIFLLNPDTEILPWTAEKLIKFFASDPNIGVIGTKIINLDGTVQKSVRQFPGVLSSLLVFSGLHRFFSPNKYLMAGFDYDTPAEVDQVMGAALATRRSVIDKIGFLDGEFWLWYEEVDFCKRARDAGYKVVYYPDAAVMHHAGKSFAQMSALDRKKTMARSLKYYFRKHGNFFSAGLISLAVPVVLAVTWGVTKVEGMLGTKHKLKI